jgi:cation/acetate symporter
MVGGISTMGVAGFWAAAAAGLMALVLWRRRAGTGGGEVRGRHWALDGMALAGNGLTGAMVLGVSGLISFYGYDGFLYAVGLAAGWFAAVVLGGARGWSEAERAAPGTARARAVVRVIVVVGLLGAEMLLAGAMVGPMLGMAPGRWAALAGGGVVIALALLLGRAGGSWSAVIRGTVLLAVSVGLAVAVCGRVLTAKGTGAFPRQLSTAEFRERLGATDSVLADTAADLPWERHHLVRVRHADGSVTIWKYKYMSRFSLEWPAGALTECREVPRAGGGPGAGFVAALPEGAETVRPAGPLGFLATVQESDLGLPTVERVVDETGVHLLEVPTVLYGEDLLAAGRMPGLFEGLGRREWWSRVNFVSLMVGLFLGMGGAAGVLRGGDKETGRQVERESGRNGRAGAVAMGVVGVVLLASLFMGLGALTGGAVDALDSNQSAGLLAGTFGEPAGLAFRLGALALLVSVTRRLMAAGAEATGSDQGTRRVLVGLMGLGVGLCCCGMNGAFVAGWALALAAAASVPWMLGRLWRGATPAGMAAGALAGMAAAAAWILLSPDAFRYLYDLGDAAKGLVPFNQPALLAVAVGVIVTVGGESEGPPGGGGAVSSSLSKPVE